jgi:glycosyltransferase involved in cell wall biosynthesis
MTLTGEKSQSPITISLCMIVKNEAATIERCLLSVAGIPDEIIIVDTGSTDQTKEIAGKFAAKIFDFAWIDDFAAARNYAFSQATQEYILWLDADDVLLAAARDNLLHLKSTLSREVDAVSMLYNLALDEEGNVTSQLRRNRLVKRDKNFRWIGAVHEYLEVYGKIFNTAIAITHKPLSHDAGRNLYIYEQRQHKGEKFSPRDLYYFANELNDHRLYNRAIEYYQKFLATKQGWVEDNIAACGKLADCFTWLNDVENQLKYTYMSFQYGAPRADFCCRLGFYHLNNNHLDQAIFWYKLATQLEIPPETWGMVNYPCQTWLPHLQLCVCYSRIGEYKLADEHNEMAAKFIPADARIAHNRAYLQNMLAVKIRPTGVFNGMEPTEFVTIAILAKDKAHVLPLYLTLIEKQTYPAAKTKLYIRTNNNRDHTAALLEQWIEKVKDRYSEIYYDASNVEEPVHEYKPHEWNFIRFRVLARLRQESVEWAKARGTHYFVVDCDNFIVPETLETLLDTGLPVIGPLLKSGDDPGSYYSNYHHITDENGYYKNSPAYYDIFNQTIKGLIEVEVIHCTYLVRNEVLDFVSYDDGSGRYEYVIFSDTLRKTGIPQYIDNRRNYGKLTFCDTDEAFKAKNITL